MGFNAIALWRSAYTNTRRSTDQWCFSVAGVIPRATSAARNCSQRAGVIDAIAIARTRAAPQSGARSRRACRLLACRWWPSPAANRARPVRNTRMAAHPPDAAPPGRWCRSCAARRSARRAAPPLPRASDKSHAACVKVAIEEPALQASARIFDVGGASAVQASALLDRDWRNLRTLFSHNPTVHKPRVLGDITVNGAALPDSSFF